MRLTLKSVQERVRPLGGRSHYDREFTEARLAEVRAAMETRI